MSAKLNKLLVIIRIRFQGVQGSELMSSWTEFLLKSIGNIVENDDLVFSLPYPKNPRETVLFFGADSSRSLSQLDDLFLRVSLEWAEYLTENGTWELDWDLSVYDFSARAMQKYHEGKQIRGTIEESAAKGPNYVEPLKLVQETLLSSRKTKSIFETWFAC
jgi:hypothetical protein